MLIRSPDIALAVGHEVQTVSVSASALLIDTEASNAGQLILNQQINDMPLNGRGGCNLQFP
jgi:hypothetical protein